MSKKENVRIRLNMEILNNITLWQAIKIRIAGKNYENVFNKIIDEMKERIKKKHENYNNSTS